MNNAIILHGKPDQDEYYNPELPSASNSHWLPWLQKELLIRDIYAQTPEIPDAWKPDYKTWQKEFERYDVTSQTMLVGHSCGGGFLVRWLSEHPDVRVGNVVLVAPSLGIDWESGDFFDFTIDSTLSSRTQKLTIFVSDDDRPAIQEAAARLRTAIPNIQYREFHNYGHFCYKQMHTTVFPELLNELTV